MTAATKSTPTATIALGPTAAVDRFRRQLAIALEFASRDPGRPILCAVHITPTQLYATDSYTLVRIDWADTDAYSFPPVLVDREDITRWRSLLWRYRKTSPTLEVAPHRVTLDCDGRTYTCPTIPGPYPNVDELVDTTAAKVEKLRQDRATAARKRKASDPAPEPVVAAFDPWLIKRLGVFTDQADSDRALRFSEPPDALTPWRFEHPATNTVGLIMPIRLR